MKKATVLILLACLIGCQSGGPETDRTDNDTLHLSPDSLPSGSLEELATPDSLFIDIDGDREKEYFWIEQPEILAEDMECRGECTCTIRSSNPRVAAYTLDSCIEGLLVEEGDLDGDGRQDLGLLPGWFTSCWRGYYLLTWKNGSWKLLVDPMDVYVCDEYPVDDFAVSSRKGYISIMVFDMVNDRMGVMQEVQCRP